MAISDVSTGIYSEQGLDIKKLQDYVANGGEANLFKDYKDGVKMISNEELLTLDVDILIPAATENQITEAIADRVKASVIVEGANGPTTIEADRILTRNGVTIVPDILANAGGVVVSYFEWVQNIQSLMWDIEEINRAQEKIMIRAFNSFLDTAQEKDV